MGAEPESRFVRAACPSFLDCLSCGGFSGSPWGWLRLAFLLLVGCSLLCLWRHTLSGLGWLLLASSLWSLSAFLCLPFYLRSHCGHLLLSGVRCFPVLFSARYDFLLFFYYFRFATIFFCPSTIFVSLRFSSVLLCDLPFPFPCDLLFSFSCDLLFVFSCDLLFILSCALLFIFSCDLLFFFSCDLLFIFSCGFFRFPRFRAGFLSSFWGTQAGMNARGLAPAGFVPGRSPWTGSRSRHLRPPTFYSISWWRSRGPAASSGVPPLLCAAIARFTSLPARYYVVTFF